MKDTASQSITLLANRSDHSVLLIASGFAVVGATLDIVSAFFIRGGSISMLWPVWIPLCFLIIPPVHYLCRRIRQLEDRIQDLRYLRSIVREQNYPNGQARKLHVADEYS